MRALKVLVVVMGVLLVGGTVTLVVLLVQRLGAGARPAAVDLALGQPEGTRIGGLATTAEGWLAVWVARPDGDRIVLVDPRRGGVIGELRVGR